MRLLPPAREFLRPAAIVPLIAFAYFILRYRSGGYVIGGALVLGAYAILYAAREKAARLPIGTSVLVFLGLALPALGAWQFLQMQDLGDMDQSAYVNALWNIRHGNLDFDIDGNNMFGIHSQYTSVLWVPVHWLAGPLGLKLGQGLCLLAACMLAARPLKGDREAAAWGAAAVLLSPAVASQFFFGFHPEMLAAPVLVLALGAYREEKLGRFLAYTAFLAYTKETLTLAVGGILLLALAERRSWKWVLLPGILCCIQMAIYWFVILPIFAPAGNHLSYFLPPTPGQILPLWWRSQNILYALHVFLPVLPLMWAFPKRYFLLPLPLMAFYAAFPDPLFVGMWTNYAHPLAFLCFAGLVLGPGPLQAPGAPGAPPSRPLDGRILMACAVTSLLCYPIWREVLSIPRESLARSRAVDALQARLPPGASVVVNGPFITRFADRRGISTWGYRKKPLEAFDYVVIDKVLPFWQFTAAQRSASVDSLSRLPGWVREYGEDGLFLFRPGPARP